jgi:hypothetical protein
MTQPSRTNPVSPRRDIPAPWPAGAPDDPSSREPFAGRPNAGLPEPASTEIPGPFSPDSDQVSVSS